MEPMAINFMITETLINVISTDFWALKSQAPLPRNVGSSEEGGETAVFAG